MIKMTLELEGMMCAMCENHMNDTLRKAFPVKKVTSSHLKKQTVIVCDEAIAEEDLKKAIEPTGFNLLSVKTEPYKKFGLFGK